MSSSVKNSVQKDSEPKITPQQEQVSTALQTAIADVCTRVGAYLIALEIRGSRERRIVEVYVDKPNGISLDECGDLSQAIGEMLEEIKAFPASYRLDVSSPGVERPLQYIWQYSRNIGRLVSVELIDGKSLRGRVSAVESDAIIFENPKKNGKLGSPKHSKTKESIPPQGSESTIFPLTVLYDTIKKAVVELEF